MRQLGMKKKAETANIIIMIILSLIVLVILFFFSGKAIEWIGSIIDMWFG